MRSRANLNRSTSLMALTSVVALGMVGLAVSVKRTTAGGQAPDAMTLPAPELVGSRWLNTPGGKPVTLASRRGRVTILHFWTFG